jgi:hypothetical protein
MGSVVPVRGTAMELYSARRSIHARYKLRFRRPRRGFEKIRKDLDLVDPLGCRRRIFGQIDLQLASSIQPA